MHYQRCGPDWFVYIPKDEPVLDTLTQFCREQRIEAAQLSGIGAIKNIALGAYDLETKSYLRTTFPATHELLSCQGNVTLKEGEPFIHAHITIGNHQMEVRGGHLFEAQVAVVGEFILRPLEGEIRRELDPEIGLFTWCLIE